jgi:hypothetical protein
MDDEAKRVIRLQFLDLLPKTLGELNLRFVEERTADPNDPMGMIYEAATFAGWCRGYAEGDGAHRAPATINCADCGEPQEILAEEHPDWSGLADEAVATILVHQQLDERIAYLMNNIRRLLEQVGKRARCRTCNKEIWYVQLRSGMVGPYQADGLNHGADCHGDMDKGGSACSSSSNRTPGPAPSED